MKVDYRVSVNLPPNVSVEAMGEYISDAVKCWKGGLSIDDPIFQISRRSFKVTKLRKVKAGHVPGSTQVLTRSTT